MKKLSEYIFFWALQIIPAESSVPALSLYIWKKHRRILFPTLPG